MKKPHCSKCGRALTDPFSIAVGMGPECRGGLSKKGWKFPKPKYKVLSGRVVFLGMDGEVVSPLTPPPLSFGHPPLAPLGCNVPQIEERDLGENKKKKVNDDDQHES